MTYDGFFLTTALPPDPQLPAQGQLVAYEQQQTATEVELAQQRQLNAHLAERQAQLEAMHAELQKVRPVKVSTIGYYFHFFTMGPFQS